MAKGNTSTVPEVPLELWRQLYRAAADFQLLAPWRWMDNSHVLGINSPRGVRLTCVMGGLGEVFGVVSYRRSTGVEILIRMLLEEIGPGSPEVIYSQDALLTEFVPSRELRKQDRRVIEKVGFEPVPGKPKRFPQFTSYLPGYLPWFIDESEAHVMLEDLQKTLRFAQLVKDQEELFESRQPQEFPFYPEVVKEPLTLDQFEWHLVSPVPSADPPIQLQPSDTAALLRVPRLPNVVWELTAFWSPDPVSGPPRPYWPKMALCVDAQSSIILAFHLGTPVETMAGAVAQCLKEAITALGCRPAAIKLDSVNLFRALGPVAGALEVKLVQVKSLPEMKKARRSLEEFSGPFRSRPVFSRPNV